MFNLGGSFEYLHCAHCGTLQLNEEIPDMGKYYPPNYGGFSVQRTKKRPSELFFEKCTVHLLIFLPYIVSKSINELLFENYNAFQCLYGQRIGRNAKIMDVGCGSGSWLSSLSEAGYRNLVGVDLFNKNRNKDFLFIEGDIFSVSDSEQCDVITMHHSFEHMEYPKKVLRKCNKLLKKNGKLIIRIPVMGKYAWKKYGKYWAQIDAPRHLFLYTERALDYLCKQCGLKIVNVYYDSTDYYQLKLSDLYQNTDLSFEMGKKRGILNKKNKEYEALSKRLNKTGNGDQAIFIIKKGGK